MSRFSAASIVLLCGVTIAAVPAVTQPAGEVGQRWTFLPRTVKSVHVDRKGRAWFEDSTDLLSQDDFRRLTADAFFGKTNTVSARVVLVDSRGVVWMNPHKSEDLIGFDGKNWTVQHPNQPRPKGNQSSAFGQEGWEDARGTIFFPDGLGIFCRTPDGKWNYQPLYERNERENRYFPLGRGPDGTSHAIPRGPKSRVFYNHCLHLSAPDGSVYVWTPSGTLGIFRFNGKSWTHFDSTNGFPDENVQSILPMPDGSIGVIPMWECVLHFWRVPGTDGRPNGLSQLVAQLGDADVTRRDGAGKAILALGRSALPQLQRELKSTDDPEIRERLRVLLRQIEQLPADLYGGRYEWKLSSGMPLQNGGVLLWLARLKDVTTGQEYIRPEILIRPGEPWRVIPTNPRTWTARVYQPFHEDTRGRLWIGGTRIDVADLGTAEPRQLISADMSDYRLAAGPDARGRMYLTNRMLQWAVFDDSAPEHDVPALVIDRWPAATIWAVPCDDGTVWAWMHDDNGPHVQVLDVGALRRYRAGKWDAPANTPTDAKLSSMMPLKHGGVLLVMQGFDGTDQSRFATYFDGMQWHQARDLRALIEVRADSLRALYDPDGQATDDERMKIDKLGNFWVTQRHSVFARYDGKQWLDLINLSDNSRPKSHHIFEPHELHLIDGGQHIFVQHGNMSWFLDSKENQVAVMQSLVGKINAGNPFGKALVDRRGNLWGQATRGKDEMVMFAGSDAAPTYLTPGGSPIFCDRDNRIWSVAGESGILRVRQGDALSSVTIDGASHSSRMTQTPDGRLFLYHSKGLSELALSGEGAHLLLSEVNHWQDGLPIGKDPRCFFSDTHGGLWLLTYSGLLRIIPPK